jgi:hypothetical protein
MYLPNKYTTWYNNIIQRAQSRVLSADTYTEKHHIIPRSLDGNDLTSNLVRLTAREHFVCHLLLTKMTTGLHLRSMCYAAWQMTHINGRPRYNASSRVYAYLRKKLSESYKGIPKTTIYWLGKKHSMTSLKKQSTAKLGSKNPNYGVLQKAEWNQKKSESQIGIPKPKYTCYNCGKLVGGKSNLDRWHNQNCSLNIV